MTQPWHPRSRSVAGCSVRSMSASSLGLVPSRWRIGSQSRLYTAKGCSVRSASGSFDSESRLYTPLKAKRCPGGSSPVWSAATPSRRFHCARSALPAGGSESAGSQSGVKEPPHSMRSAASSIATRSKRLRGKFRPSLRDRDSLWQGEAFGRAAGMTQPWQDAVAGGMVVTPACSPTLPRCGRDRVPVGLLGDNVVLQFAPARRARLRERMKGVVRRGCRPAGFFTRSMA